jgi:hypothetical protein
MIFDSLSIVTIMSEVIFLAALGRFAWKNREKETSILGLACSDRHVGRH